MRQLVTGQLKTAKTRKTFIYGVQIHRKLPERGTQWLYLGNKLTGRNIHFRKPCTSETVIKQERYTSQAVRFRLWGIEMNKTVYSRNFFRKFEANEAIFTTDRIRFSP